MMACSSDWRIPGKSGYGVPSGNGLTGWNAFAASIQNVALCLQLGDFTTQPIDFKLHWIHLPFSEKKPAGIMALFA
jgi:hypothetical protein